MQLPKMAEGNEEMFSDDFRNGGQVRENTQSRQHHVSSASDTTPEASDINDEQRISEEALNELIPQLTRRGTINPDSPAFSTEKFLREMLTRAKEQGLRRRNAGVVFRSLVVLGYGSDFTHQKTVGTMATSITRVLQNIRARRHPPMKTILYSMDGVVKEGEMLLVLGKPGSGATTLLKTIAGETRSYASVSGGSWPLGCPFLIVQISTTMVFPTRLCINVSVARSHTTEKSMFIFRISQLAKL